MMIHDVTKKVGKYRARKRRGRGDASGLGGTSGRGHKGAKSRSGWSYRPHFEGGQMEHFRRLPKRGFTNAPFKQDYTIVNLKKLNSLCKSGDNVDLQSLKKHGLVRHDDLPLKVLGEGEITKKINVTAAKFSASAKAKIEKAGGTVTVIPAKKWLRPETTTAPAKKAPDKKS